MRALTTLSTIFLGLVTLLTAPLPAHADHPIGCNYCHVKGKFGPQRAAVCLSCHGPGGSSTLRATAHIQMDCLDCHGSHGGGSFKMLRYDIDRTGKHSDPQGYVDRFANQHIKTPPENYAPVVFTSRGTGAGEPSLHSFADGDEDGNGVYDGICEVCHLEFLYQNEQASGPHHIGETCTACHLHSNGFR